MSTPLLPERAVTMPFGKYRHWDIQCVPDDYLHWLMRRGQIERWWPVFEQQLRAEMDRRRRMQERGT